MSPVFVDHKTTWDHTRPGCDVNTQSPNRENNDRAQQSKYCPQKLKCPAYIHKDLEVNSQYWRIASISLNQTRVSAVDLFY